MVAMKLSLPRDRRHHGLRGDRARRVSRPSVTSEAGSVTGQAQPQNRPLGCAGLCTTDFCRRVQGRTCLRIHRGPTRAVDYAACDRTSSPPSRSTRTASGWARPVAPIQPAPARLLRGAGGKSRTAHARSPRRTACSGSGSPLDCRGPFSVPLSVTSWLRHLLGHIRTGRTGWVIRLTGADSVTQSGRGVRGSNHGRGVQQGSFFAPRADADEEDWARASSRGGLVLCLVARLLLPQSRLVTAVGGPGSARAASPRRRGAAS